MTCITGETGAGKSILMGGLGLVLGKRADLSVLKDNKKKCIIEASFLIGSYNLKDFFAKAGLDYEEETLLRREIVPNGKSRAFINDTPVNLDLLVSLSEVLIDVHSQLENQSLFKNEYQFLVLDAVAGNQEIIKDYKNKLSKYQNTKKEFDQLKQLNEDSAKIQDWYYLGNFNTNQRAYHCSVLGYTDTPSYSAGQTLNYHVEVGFYTANYSLSYSAQNGQLKSTIFVYEMGA